MTQPPLELDGPYPAASRTVCPHCGNEIRDHDGAVHAERHSLKTVLDAYELNQQALEQEIHENAIQPLTAALLHLQAAGQRCLIEPERSLREIEVITDLIQLSMEHLRETANQLRPSVLDDFGILAAIQHVVQKVKQDHRHMEVRFTHTGLFHRTDPMIEIGFFRVAQSLLEHAKSRYGTEKLEIVLISSDGHISLDVQRRGVCVRTSPRAEDVQRLEELGARARMLGGQLSVNGDFVDGTGIAVEIPWENDAFQEY